MAINYPGDPRYIPPVIPGYVFMSNLMAGQTVADGMEGVAKHLPTVPPEAVLVVPNPNIVGLLAVHIASEFEPEVEAFVAKATRILKYFEAMAKLDEMLQEAGRGDGALEQFTPEGWEPNDELPNVPYAGE